MGAKDALRQTMTARLDALDSGTVAAVSRRVCRALAGLWPSVLLREATHVAVYAAFGSEVRLDDFVAACRARGVAVCFPRFRRAAGVYEMVPVADPENDLEPGHWGLPEPAPSLPAVSEEVRREALHWLIPGLAFDQFGRRLGRGGGYYDRLLAKTRGARIAVAHECQLVDEVPADRHDERVHAIVTERRVIRCSAAARD